MEKKLTKKDLFARMIEVLEETAVEDKDALIEFAEKEIASLVAKAAKSKTYKRKKKEVTDSLKAEVVSLLDSETFKTIAQILSAIGKDGVSAAMVTARLTALVKDGLVEKQDVKTADKRTVKGYKLVVVETEVEEVEVETEEA